VAEASLKDLGEVAEMRLQIGWEWPGPSMPLHATFKRIYLDGLAVVRPRSVSGSAEQPHGTIVFAHP
jgi:hypothetical protein